LLRDAASHGEEYCASGGQIMGWMKDETGLEKRPANFVPLTPLSHLIRAARVFPERTAVVDGAFRATYAEYFTRVTQLASSLSKRGINPGDVVAAVLPNTHPHVEAHFGVPACGAVLNSINIRLDTGTISYILDHGEAKIVLSTRNSSAWSRPR
jgi:fatty-acyl-CoA synthase